MCFASQWQKLLSTKRLGRTGGPTQLVPVVRQTDSGREFSTMRWGLVPSWADDPKIGYKMINARSEDAATKPSFRSAMMATSLRCEALVHNFAGGTPALINNEPRITDINSTNTSSQKKRSPSFDNPGSSSS